ncbi:hypothetical protein [Candidatus Magnetaquiglobus chichijimensis]
MSEKLKFVDLSSMYHLTDGLTLKVSRCAEVLDSSLVELNKIKSIPSSIVKWNQRGMNPALFPSLPIDGRLIIEVTQTYSVDTGKIFYACTVINKKDETQSAPIVFFIMRSLALDIPIRLEIPLRALLKGGRSLSGTYSVYLHGLFANNGEEFVYYGITKRGWNKRFMEHVTASTRDQSKRLFPRKLGDLIAARAAELNNISDSRPKLSGIITVLCAVGLSEDQAMDTEEYLVDKYSLSSKHGKGLNMIPGGYEGLRSLHKLSIQTGPDSIDTESREELLDRYLHEHPRIGVPNPGVAEKWNDPGYAEAVICGRENRLTADQVREIRYLSALGYPTDKIQEKVGAIDNGQVQRVLNQRTYSRIH